MPSRIGDALHWYATYTPDKVALVSSLGTQTYSQLWSRVCRLSSALTALGVGPGDRIALLMQNSGRYIEVYQAAALMGAACLTVSASACGGGSKGISKTDYLARAKTAPALLILARAI